MSLCNFGFVAREDSDLGDHDVISSTDDGQAAEGKEKRPSSLSSGPATKKSKLSSSAYEATRMRTYKETWKKEFHG